MSLSCECGDNEYDWYFYEPSDYSIIDEKDKKCESCKSLIDVGSTVTCHLCYQEEEDGDVPLDNIYHCEKCADIQFNLIELGFCVRLGDNMNDLLEEYKDMYGPEDKNES